MIWGIIIIVIVATDQITKFIVSHNMTMGDSITVIEKFFYFTYWENKGAAWSMFQGGRYFFIAATIIVSIVLVYILRKSENKLFSLSLAFILGGAIGNLIDRVYKGSVTDFFAFHFGLYQFPIFNVADSCVTVGTILLGYYLLFIHKEKEANEQ